LGAAGKHWLELVLACTVLPVAQLHCGWNTPFSGPESAVIRDVFQTHEQPLLLDGDMDGISLREQRVVAVLSEVSGAHIAVPLCLPDRLYGVVLLSAPVSGDSIVWEDEELLGLAARQIASFLAHNDAQAALGVSRQLDSFNQMTAFVVHDLKTVVAQLSLMGRNAEKHRDNPGFVDDMIRTSAHAADRIQTLLQHLRRQRESVKAHVANLPLREIAAQVVANQQERLPVPELSEEVAGLQVRANCDQLVTILGHLVQNAQQVCPADGRIVLRVLREGDWNAIRIEDDGPVLIELAPGVDLERDVLAKMAFRPRVAVDLREMEPALFQEANIGLPSRIAAAGQV
jgi:putative PEP-CTERM system histidine kinase